jgi:hypothetical protein
VTFSPTKRKIEGKLEGSKLGKSAYSIENQAIRKMSHFNPEKLTEIVKMIRYITYDITQQTSLGALEFGADV